MQFVRLYQWRNEKKNDLILFILPVKSENCEAQANF